MDKEFLKERVCNFLDSNPEASLLDVIKRYKLPINIIRLNDVRMCKIDVFVDKEKTCLLVSGYISRPIYQWRRAWK